MHPKAILLADTSAKGPTPLLAGPDQVPIIRFAAAAIKAGLGRIRTTPLSICVGGCLPKAGLRRSPSEMT